MRVDELTKEEGFGFDIEDILDHRICRARLLMPQAIGKYVPYTSGVFGSIHVFNPISNTDSVIQCLAWDRLARSSTANKCIKASHVNTRAKCARYIKYDSGQLPLAWDCLSELENKKNILNLCIRASKRGRK